MIDICVVIVSVSISAVCFSASLEIVIMFNVLSNFYTDRYHVACSQELETVRRLSSCCEYLCFVRAHSRPEGSSSSWFTVYTVTAASA